MALRRSLSPFRLCVSTSPHGACHRGAERNEPGVAPLKHRSPKRGKGAPEMNREESDFWIDPWLSRPCNVACTTSNFGLGKKTRRVPSDYWKDRLLENFPQIRFPHPPGTAAREERFPVAAG